MTTRAKKPLQLMTKKMSTEEKSQRAEMEQRLKIPRNELVAPDWLDYEGKKEFERVVSAALLIDLFDNLDLGILAIYANAYSKYVEVTQEISEEGMLEERATRYDRYKQVSPLVQLQDKYIKQIMTCSSKLGLATTDRLKLIVPVKEESQTNKYLKYLDG